MPEEIRADSRRLLQRERASQTTAVACDRSQASGDNAFLLVSQFSVTGVPLERRMTIFELIELRNSDFAIRTSPVAGGDVARGVAIANPEGSRLLDPVEDFTLFSEHKAGLVKIIG
jgi:hypothetical protein